MTDKSVVDWTQPLEAVHLDGRVIAIGELRKHANPMWPEKAKSADGLIQFYINRSANNICAGALGDGWRIRNVTPSSPLSLETSDLDPITPEEDALATAIIAAVGRTRQSLHTVVRAIRDGLATAGAVIVPGWQPIETAPRDGTEIQARIPGHGEDNVIAWQADAFLDTDEQTVGGWAFTREQEPPECWTDGICWAVNEDEIASVQPTHWMPLLSAHSIQSGGEGGGRHEPLSVQL